MARRLSVELTSRREILVRGPNWLGDLVMSTPGLRALRHACPEARITVWVRAGHEAVLDGSPHVDRCLPLRASSSRGWGLLDAARIARRSGDYDLGICLPDSFSSALLMRGAGARPIVGYARAGRGLLLDVAVSDAARRRAGGFIAREQYVLGLLRAIGIEADDTSLALATTPCEEAAAEALLGKLGCAPGGGPIVGLAPGAGFGASKCWPAERFAAVGDALSRDGARVLLIGSPGEAELCASVARGMRETAFDSTGRVGLGPLKAVMRALDLLVCNDAGARHLAAAFGVPTIVLFGPTSVAKTPLNLENVSIVERDVPCRPCYLRDCPIDHRCLADIAAADVLSLARTRLGGDAA